jgi:hypothetical protein
MALPRPMDRVRFTVIGVFHHVRSEAHASLFRRDRLPLAATDLQQAQPRNEGDVAWSAIHLRRGGLRDRHVKAEMRALLEDPENDVLFNAASVWEIAIKAALGRADFGVSLEAIVEAAHASGFVELPVRSAAAMRVATLPRHHRILSTGSLSPKP